MILEHAVLEIANEQQSAFEAAFSKAVGLIASSPGCISVRLERGHEEPSRYLLLVEWERLEDHTVGFRGSDAYQQWRALLHHFYDPAPVVEHFSAVAVSMRGSGSQS